MAFLFFQTALNTFVFRLIVWSFIFQIALNVAFSHLVELLFLISQIAFIFLFFHLTVGLSLIFQIALNICLSRFTARCPPPAGLRVTGSKLCWRRILAALGACSRRHPVVPKRRGQLQTHQSGEFSPLPFRFHPKNPFLIPSPFSPLWKL